VGILTEEVSKTEEKVTLSKDTIYGSVIVVLVALLVLSVFTQGFGILPGKAITVTTGTTVSGNSTTSGSTTGIAMITGVQQLTVGIGSLPAYGKESAPVSWIEFSDFQCPFCEKLVTQTNSKIKSNYVSSGKVKMYWRDLPLSFHDKADDMAAAARGAAEQGKFWEMHDKIFEKQTAWSSVPEAQIATVITGYAKDIGLDSAKFDAYLAGGTYAANITQDKSDAGDAGVSGTPGVFLLLPKDKTDYTSVKNAISKYGEGIQLYQDEKNIIVFVAGAYPYEAFDAILKTVK
jgi:protein-disulfide isomerase